MLIRNEEDLLIAKGDILSSDRVSCDTETTGLSQDDRLFAIIFGTKYETYYIDKRVYWDTAAIAQLLEHNCEWIFQNAKFDLRMLKHEGLEPRGIVRDLEVLARLVNNSHFLYSLEAIGARRGLPKSEEVIKYITKNKLYTDVPLIYSKGESRKLHFDKVPTDIMQSYAERDARITYDLYDIEHNELDERSYDLFDSESMLTKVCARMEERGVHINVDYTKKALEYESGIVSSAKNRFEQMHGVPYSESKGVLVPILQSEGLEIPKTAKGNFSLTDEILEGFNSNTAKIVQEVRHYEKRISTYYTAFLESLSSDGRLHPDMRQAGTTTGRFSYRDPNLQNVPKEDDEEDATKPFLVRGCIQPSPGNILVSLDYSQQEYRLMLAYADEQRLIRKVMDGEDLHQATADLVGVTRKHAKTLNFAILYGAGVDKIATMLGISSRAARDLRDKYFSRLPKVESFISKAIRTSRARGHLYNWAGRKLLTGGRDFAYKLPNHLIQGGGADICKKAMIEIDKILPKENYPMILQVHDSLTFDMHPSQLHLVEPIRDIMNNVFPMKNGMKIIVDIEASTKSLAAKDQEPWEKFQ